MENKQEKSSSSSPAPFLIKTYEMVDDYSTDHIVSWSNSGCSFVVWDPPEFSQDLLPKYFKHNNFSSFVRQLNTYGFRKVDPDLWEFANPEFVKGQRHLLNNIHRRKPIHSHSAQGSSSVMTETERFEYEKEIRRLEREKNSLQLEVQRQDKERQQFELEKSSLGHRLRGMETRQMQLLSFLGQLVQNPGFVHNKKRRFMPVDQLLEVNPDGSSLINHFEVVEKLDSSLTQWESFFNNISHDDLAAHFGGASTREASAASSASAESCSSRSLGIPSSPELVECFREIPLPLPSINQSVETFRDSCEAKRRSGSDAKSSNELIGVNDHFWQHFLTEAPGSDARTAC